MGLDGSRGSCEPVSADELSDRCTAGAECADDVLVGADPVGTCAPAELASVAPGPVIEWAVSPSIAPSSGAMTRPSVGADGSGSPNDSELTVGDSTGSATPLGTGDDVSPTR